MKIYVDADASPVKDIVIAAGEDFHLSVVLVSSIAHYSSVEQPTHVEIVYVENQKEAADYRIIQLAKKGDLVITQDYGLASLLLAKGCYVLHHNGMEYNINNIDHLLQTRYLNALSRKSGKHTKGPKAFTEEKKEVFRHVLYKLLRQVTKKEDEPS